MYSNREEKLIRSLQKKKFRQAEGLFVLEGSKLLSEALKSNVELLAVYYTSSNEDAFNWEELGGELISDRQMEKISSLKTAPGILATVKIPQAQLEDSRLILYLEGISDPGNMGTIIRTAEGFGIDQIILSADCVELFSPKVVQASMGSLFRMKFHYSDLSTLKGSLGGKYQFYAADMDGEEHYTAQLKLPAVLILGSESHGVSDEAKEDDVNSLSIPISEKLESLNVSIANAIILSEFKRRSLI